MADLLPHYKSRVPAYWSAQNGESIVETEVPHALAGNFPSGYNPSDGDDQTLDPVGGVAGPIVDATTGLAAAAPSPGTWQPLASLAAADLAAMQAGIIADPLTAWTEGQGMALADGTMAHWDSSAWVAGKAPA